MIKEINGANIRAIEWSDGTMILHFFDGSVVAYLDIPEGIYAGVCEAKSAGSYLRLYVYGKYSYRKIKESDIEHKVKALEHHKTLTVGLWATDRSDLIPEELKEVFFQIEK
jgi:hypothetical protein